MFKLSQCAFRSAELAMRVDGREETLVQDEEQSNALMRDEIKRQSEHLRTFWFAIIHIVYQVVDNKNWLNHR